MGAITDNVCACKQSSKIRRWKEEWVQGKSRCDVTGALCRQMTWGMVFWMECGMERKLLHSPQNQHFFLRERTLPLPTLRNFVYYCGIRACIKVRRVTNKISSLQFSAEQCKKAPKPHKTKKTNCPPPKQQTKTCPKPPKSFGMSPQSRVGPLVLRGTEGKKHRLSVSQSLLAGVLLREGCVEDRSEGVER